jgi:16S rRNA (guanine1516-N2)-methyltransferase
MNSHDSIQHKIRIAIQADSPEHEKVAQLAQELSLPLLPATQTINQDDFDFVLSFTQGRLELQQLGNDAPGAVYVDFEGGKLAHRRKHGGGKGQPLAKAVGLKKSKTPFVLDATAGLGRDAYVLACLGCKVKLIEQSRVIAALLRDALNRAIHSPELAPIIEHMSLVVGDAIHLMADLSDKDKPDVVYLDPMYPKRDKSALVKKEMQILQTLIGDSGDSEKLLSAALGCARQRVVVKRPASAPPLEGPTPTMTIHSKNTRYDVYLTAI